MNFSTNNTERLRINSSGNVGIGTTTPGYKLTVNSSNATDNLFQVATTTNQGIMVINNAGNVGIGTAGPNSPLDVRDVYINATDTNDFGRLKIEDSGSNEANSQLTLFKFSVQTIAIIFVMMALVWFWDKLHRRGCVYHIKRRQRRHRAHNTGSTLSLC